MTVTGEELNTDGTYASKKEVSSPLLTITKTDQSVTLALIQFIGKTSSELSSYLIQASSGKLTLNGVSFTSITLTTTSLISVSPTSGYFEMTSTTYDTSKAKKCTFTSIT